jgi:Rad3-related DNA helicase
MLEETIDIEDLAKLGRSEKICPYYGARHSINTAEIVALPYNLLFQKETRESFNINLKNQVVIIDEAHNLIDTIASIHSVEISDQHVSQALAQLNNYMTRYRSRFAAKNMLYLKHLLNILNTLNKFFTAKPDDVKFEAQDGKLSLSWISNIWVFDFFVRFRTILLIKCFSVCLSVCDIDINYRKLA